MNKRMYCNKNFVAHVMLTNHKKVKSRSHQTKRVKLSGLLYLFNEVIRAGILMFQCSNAPSSGLISDPSSWGITIFNMVV